jgi:AcrR family transcriptional regulator
MAILSTADSRRPIVAAAAVRAFARAGYHGTTIADVAREAKISPAYVSKLYASKDLLFVAALEECFARVQDAIAAGADAATSDDPDSILEAMGDAYAGLIADRSLLMLQVHAQSVAGVAEIGEAFRAAVKRITVFAQERSGGDDDAVQRFLAYGQLCHLIVTFDLESIPEPWATTVTHGIRHP